MKNMSYEEVMKFSLEHYNEGGDSTYECLSKKDYEREIANGKVYTKKNLLESFRLYESIRKEIMNA